MLAKKKISSLMLALLFSASAWAGLGGIAVRSNLGEVLRAEIDLTGKGEEELLRVGLAPIETFRDLQVDYSPAMSSLRFALAYRSNGRPYIRVTSTAPISDPYLRFVVEARASSARYVREYTVLLDPAEYPARADDIARSSRPVVTPLPAETAPKVRPLPRMTPRDTLPTAAPRVADSVLVRKGQTLSGIARGLGISAATTRQVMAGLVQANPHAFAQGDPARLLAGARLKVPAATTMRALKEARVAEILRSGAPAVAPLAQPAPQVGKPPVPPQVAVPAPAPAVPGHGQPVLKVEAPEASSPAVKQPDPALQDAQKRIAELEKQLQALQLAASAAKPAVPVAPAPSPASAHVPVAPPHAEEEVAAPGVMDAVMENLPLIAGGGAAVLLLSALVVFLRRRKQTASSAVPTEVSISPASVAPSGADSAGESTFLTDFTRTSMNTVDTVEVDPVAEAEVYLAYGRDQQAEDILKDALAKDPTRHEVRLKLMEIYAGRKDKLALDEHVKELFAVTGGVGAVWARAVALARPVDPEHPLFAEPAGEGAEPAAASSSEEFGDDLDRDLMGETPVQPAMPAAEPEVAPVMASPDLDIEALLNAEEPVVAPPPPPEPVADEPNHMLDFDFDLGASAGASAEEPAVVAEPVADEPVETFDFDLSSLDMPAPESAQENVAVSTEGLSVTDDPLSTKLDLARVYLDMGDKEGAKEVLEELVKEAQGPLLADAQSLLDTL